MSQHKYSDREILIAEWLGFVEWQKSKNDTAWRPPKNDLFPHAKGELPHFDTDSYAAAVLLIYIASLGWDYIIGVTCMLGKDMGMDNICSDNQPTLAEAVADAVEQLIRREGK